MNEAELHVRLPESTLDLIAERAAVIVLERLEERGRETELVSVDEAAELLRCKKQRIYELCSAGVLNRYRDGGRLLLRRSELYAHVGIGDGLDRRRRGRRVA